VNDVAEAFGEFVNEQSYEFAATGRASYPLVAPEGGKEPLNARMAEFSLGSDHQIYTDSSFGIPAIYLNDWPDRYIHTNFDTPANIDPTKLKRAGFISAASGYFLANVSATDGEAVWRLFQSRSSRRTAQTMERQIGLSSEESLNLERFAFQYERVLFNSMSSFFNVPQSARDSANALFRNFEEQLEKQSQIDRPKGDAGMVFNRNPKIKGTMGAFGYDYFTDKYGAEKARALRLPRYQGLRGSGGEYTYEVLNLVDGKRNAQQIRDDVSAIYGPVPLDVVLEYLRALESINVIRRVS
jgi:hypothetical protein